jgi:hypothetical protein
LQYFPVGFFCFFQLVYHIADLVLDEFAKIGFVSCRTKSAAGAIPMVEQAQNKYPVLSTWMLIVRE